MVLWHDVSYNAPTSCLFTSRDVITLVEINSVSATVVRVHLNNASSVSYQSTSVYIIAIYLLYKYHRRKPLHLLYCCSIIRCYKSVTLLASVYFVKKTSTKNTEPAVHSYHTAGHCIWTLLCWLWFGVILQRLFLRTLSVRANAETGVFGMNTNMISALDDQWELV